MLEQKTKQHVHFTEIKLFISIVFFCVFELTVKSLRFSHPAEYETLRCEVEVNAATVLLPDQENNK